MPWKKTFNTDDAIDHATHVFWAKGYEAASLADLLKATNINKGSFYNAFGSKKSLFTQSLLKYDKDHRQRVLKQLCESEQPVAAIHQFFDLLIEDSLNDKVCKGCFLINTALDLPNHDQDIAKIIKHSMSELEAFFETQITLGLEDGSITQPLDPAITAKSLLALLVGLRVLSRGIFDEQSLIAIKSQVVNLTR